MFRQTSTLHSTSETYEAAWRSWKDARFALEDSLANYALACDAFRNTCGSPAHTAPDRAKLEQILVLLDKELPSLHSSEGILRNTRQNLLQTRNRSTTLVPINKLPVETLVLVFTILATKDSCSTRQSSRRSQYKAFGLDLRAVMSVCTHWHLTALETKSLWAHIDFIFTAHTQARQLLWLERSRGTPLFFHASYPAIPSLSRSSMDYLTPHVRNFVSIEFSHYADLSSYTTAIIANSRNAVDDLFELWLTHGAPGSVRRLELHFRWKEDSLLLGASRIDFISDRSAKFLRPVRILALTAVVLDWRSPVFHGLVDLRLSLLEGAQCPSITEIATILEASPDLETLKLSHMTIRLDDSATLTPIHLPHLKCLNLRGLKPLFLDILLPLIVPGSKDMSLSLGLKRVQLLSAKILDFLRRTRVTTLFVYGLKQPQWFTHIMSLLPHLENLAVHSCVLYQDMITKQPSLSPGSNPTPPILRLPNLYLLSCQSNPSLLFHLCAKGVTETQKVYIWRALKAPRRIEFAPLNVTLIRTNHPTHPIPISDVEFLEYRRAYPFLGWTCLD